MRILSSGEELDMICVLTQNWPSKGEQENLEMFCCAFVCQLLKIL